MHALKRVGQALLVILAVPILVLVVLVALPVALPYVIFIGIRDWVLSRLYFIRNSGRVYLVLDGRHGWRPFIENNLIPAAPPGISVVWMDSEGSAIFRDRVRRSFNAQRPHLTLLTIAGPKTISIHDRLLQYKGLGKRDDGLQARLRELLSSAIGELRGPEST